MQYAYFWYWIVQLSHSSLGSKAVNLAWILPCEFFDFGQILFMQVYFLSDDKEPDSMDEFLD